ncbi:MAG: hypothetical protein FWE13_01270 [Firmicutes bacterium]|nr:hypothetical protein [Bacillota bacterium]
MFDCNNNVLIFETDEIIDNADGNYFFLVEGKVKEHREVAKVKQTILTECDCELVSKNDKIKGRFFGEIGAEVKLLNVTASFRRMDDIEWKVTGEFSMVTPKSE